MFILNIVAQLIRKVKGLWHVAQTNSTDRGHLLPITVNFLRTVYIANSVQISYNGCKK